MWQPPLGFFRAHLGEEGCVWPPTTWDRGLCRQKMGAKRRKARETLGDHCWSRGVRDSMWSVVASLVPCQAGQEERTGLGPASRSQLSSVRLSATWGRGSL